MTRRAVPELSHAVNHICVNERICYVHAAKCSAGMASCLASVSSKIWQVFGEEFLEIGRAHV